MCWRHSFTTVFVEQHLSLKSIFSRPSLMESKSFVLFDFPSVIVSCSISTKVTPLISTTWCFYKHFLFVTVTVRDRRDSIYVYNNVVFAYKEDTLISKPLDNICLFMDSILFGNFCIVVFVFICRGKSINRLGGVGRYCQYSACHCYLTYNRFNLKPSK